MGENRLPAENRANTGKNATPAGYRWNHARGMVIGNQQNALIHAHPVDGPALDLLTPVAPRKRMVGLFQFLHLYCLTLQPLLPFRRGCQIAKLGSG